MPKSVPLVVLLALATAAAAAGPKPSAPSTLSLVQAICGGRCTCADDADCGAGGTCGDGLCVAGAPARVGCNGDSDCAAARTCPAAPHPCSSAIRIASGRAVVRSSKQPGPTLEPEEQNGGEVRLLGVTRDGAPFTGTLTAGVTLKTTISADANGNCPVGNFHITVESLTGTIACRAGKCRGRLVPIAGLGPLCADVAINSELVSLVVRDETGAVVATPGISIPAGKGDAS
jgi:hypothetical protein